jgi:hypothetical protein
VRLEELTEVEESMYLGIEELMYLEIEEVEEMKS